MPPNTLFKGSPSILTTLVLDPSAAFSSTNFFIQIGTNSTVAFLNFDANSKLPAAYG